MIGYSVLFMLSSSVYIRKDNIFGVAMLLIGFVSLVIYFMKQRRDKHHMAVE